MILGFFCVLFLSAPLFYKQYMFIFPLFVQSKFWHLATCQINPQQLVHTARVEGKRVLLKVNDNFKFL